MLKLAKVGPFKGSISKVVDFEQSPVLTGDKGDMHMMSSLSFESAHPFHLLSFLLPKLENPHSLAQCRSGHLSSMNDIAWFYVFQTQCMYFLT